VSEPWATSGLDLLVRATPGRRRASLEEDLREAVRTGRLAPGDRLPSTRVLAADLRLSRGTVTAAYDQLVAEGYLVTRRGLGTLVGDVVTAQRPRTPRSP
jgi:GntR family transcriptional regulator/MocR family aminotransferase